MDIRLDWNCAKSVLHLRLDGAKGVVLGKVGLLLARVGRLGLGVGLANLFQACQLRLNKLVDLLESVQGDFRRIPFGRNLDLARSIERGALAL